MGGSSRHCTPQRPEVTVVVPTLPQTAVQINGQATFDVKARGKASTKLLIADTFAGPMDFLRGVDRVTVVALSEGTCLVVSPLASARVA